MKPRLKMRKVGALWRGNKLGNGCCWGEGDCVVAGAVAVEMCNEGDRVVAGAGRA